MIGINSKVKIVDNSGVVLGKCIKVLGNKKKAKINDYILLSIKQYRTKKGFLKDKKKRLKFKRGSIYVAYIIRTRSWYRRDIGIFLKFNENSCILVNKKRIPIASRLLGPVLLEYTRRHNNLMSMSLDLI